MSRTNLLIEIGTEELPPKSLAKLAQAFAQGIEQGVTKQTLSFEQVSWYASPRRLAVIIDGIELAQADQTIQKRGPAIKAAYDDEGKPTKAAEGFARSCGVEFSELQTLKTDKGEWLAYDVHQKGQQTSELLPEIIHTSLNQLPIPKRMRWGDKSIEFVRPIHWVIVMLGDQTVDCKILDIPAGNQTRGHRFHANKTITVSSTDAYVETLLNQGKVMVDYAERKNTIRSAVEAAAHSVNAEAIIDEDLLDEVTSLIEWPVILLGEFDEHFLQLPRELLVSSMQDHQKYFALQDNKQLINKFITVSNIESDEPELIVHGNQRVITPRLSDADFFWQRDKQNGLDSLKAGLAKVTYQQKLGSLQDKVQRISNIANFISDKLNHDKALASRAAEICKCDLLTDMVGEFPELQGIIGRYLAEHANEDMEVAAAMAEQYQPRFAGDALPATQTGSIISIADKLDTLVGIFSIGQIPTGDKDPFGLRRAALGIIRILLESKIDLNISELIEHAVTTMPSELDTSKVKQSLQEFITERMRRYFLEQDITADTLAAVIAVQSNEPLDFKARLEAVIKFRGLTEAESLAAANKRIANILKKHDGEIASEIDNSLLQEEAEKNLYQVVSNSNDEVEKLLVNKDYSQALSKLASLKEPVDTFFDEVMVNCDDEAIKNNRLALLQQINTLFLGIADISCLQS